MLTNQAYALNMPMRVSCLIVSLTDLIHVTPFGDVASNLIDIAGDGPSCPYTLTATGNETFDDLNDAIAYASRGDANTYGAYIITSNINYPDDQFDLVIYSRLPVTIEHLHGS